MEVKIKMTGDNDEDFRRAYEAAKISPSDAKDFTWHHHQDCETMQLIPTEVNKGANYPHTGGAAIVKHANGRKSIFEMAEEVPGVAAEMASALAPSTATAVKSAIATGLTVESAKSIANGAATDVVDTVVEAPMMASKAVSGLLEAGANASERAHDSYNDSLYQQLGPDGITK